MPKITLSILIVNFNTRDKIKLCLDSVFKSECDFEFDVIVIDNDSNDGSCDLIKNHYPSVKLIQSNINLGFAGANNKAYQDSKGDFVLCLNPDTIVRVDTLQWAISTIKEHENIGVLGGKLLNPDKSDAPSARTYPSSFKKVILYLGLAKAGSKFEFANKIPFTNNTDLIDCDYVVGAFLLTRKEIIDQLGFFDDKYFLYYEEVDFCKKVKSHGWRIACTPRSVIEHDHGSSTKYVKSLHVSNKVNQVLRFRLQAEYIYYRKNYTILSVLTNFFAELVLLAIFAIKTKNRPQFKIFIKESIYALRNTKFGSFSPEAPWN